MAGQNGEAGESYRLRRRQVLDPHGRKYQRRFAAIHKRIPVAAAGTGTIKQGFAKPLIDTSHAQFNNL